MPAVPRHVVSGMADPVWFWQRIVSPHMAGLAAALASIGHDVTYVAEQEMSADRAEQGWQAPSLGSARLLFASTPEAMRGTVRAAPAKSIHICQGFRGNGLVGAAREALALRGLRQWVIMETVDDAGWRGIPKRLEYRRLIRRWHPHLEGVFAIGHATPGWLVKRGMPAKKYSPSRISCLIGNFCRCRVSKRLRLSASCSRVDLSNLSVLHCCSKRLQS